MTDDERKDMAQKITDLIFDNGYATNIRIYWAAQEFLKEVFPSIVSKE